MVAKSRHNAALCGFTHVEVYEADITKLPLPDNCADVVISNGAINLSLNKTQVLSEARRILRPGGRLQVADMIRETAEGDSEEDHNDSWADCVLGTLEAECFLRLIEGTGFQQVTLVSKTCYKTSENTVGALFRAIKSV